MKANVQQTRAVGGRKAVGGVNGTKTSRFVRGTRLVNATKPTGWKVPARRNEVQAIATPPKKSEPVEIPDAEDAGPRGMFTNTDPSVRRIVPDAKGRPVVKIVYTVLEAQYQSSLSAAVKHLNETREEFCVQLSGYLLEELRSEKNVAEFRKDVQEANIFIGSLIFIEELAEKVLDVVQPERERMDAVLIFPSMPAVMRLNKLGSFSMAQLGQSKSVVADFMKAKKAKGGGGFEDGMLKLIRTLPKVLKYLPSDKAQDARSFMMSLQYWLGGSPENLENFVTMIANTYVPALQSNTMEYADPVVFPDVGIWHPMAPAMYEDVKEYLNWYDTRKDLKFAKDAPVIGLVLQRTHLVTGDEGHYSAQVMELEARGAKVIPIFAGYNVGDLPATEEELIESVLHDKEAQFASPDLNIEYKMPVAEYQKLCTYSGALEENWGPPPGNLNSDGANMLVYGKKYGNIFIGVQPTFGYEDNIKTYGESLAQVMEIVGVRPKPDALGRVNKVELISLEELGRPRIDVVVNCSGVFRDLFINQMNLLDRAVKLAAEADEPLEMNFVRKHSLEQAEEMGVSLRQAATRIFSNASGSYSSNVNLAVENSSWNDEAQLQDMYLSRKSFAFNSDAPGAGMEESKAIFESSLKTVDATFQNLDSMDNWVYEEANDTFINDPEMCQRLMDTNPNSFRKLVATFLEANGRGYWDTSEENLDRLRKLYTDVEDKIEGVE
eukprot:jgi/Pico_ML_1/52268/g2997.t1